MNWLWFEVLDVVDVFLSKYFCPGKAKISCPVCGDTAVAHFHYGGMCCYSCKAFFRRVVNTYKVFEFYYYYLMPSIMSHFTRNRILICKLSAGHFFLSGFYIIALPSYQPGHNLSGPNLILSSVSPSCSTLRCPSDFWVTGTGFIISVQTLLRISKQTRSHHVSVSMRLSTSTRVAGDQVHV